MKNKIFSIIWLFIGMALSVLLGLYIANGFVDEVLLEVIWIIFAFIFLAVGIFSVGNAFFEEKKATQDGTLAMIAFIVAIVLPISSLVAGICYKKGVFGHSKNSYTSTESYDYTSSYKSDDKDYSYFSNKYGTKSTKCAQSGCNNYIASSGDTCHCVAHSNKCLECRCYIDGDAMYCMDCLSDAVNGLKNDSDYGHECYVCGKKAYSKYGSYYYCSSCLDLVKAFSY
jgi:hypothetical protein